MFDSAEVMANIGQKTAKLFPCRDYNGSPNGHCLRARNIVGNWPPLLRSYMCKLKFGCTEGSEADSQRTDSFGVRVC